MDRVLRDPSFPPRFIPAVMTEYLPDTRFDRWTEEPESLGISVSLIGKPSSGLLGRFGMNRMNRIDSRRLCIH